MKRTFNEVLHSSPDIQIGKNGVTQGLLEHINNRLNKEKTLKLKVLERVPKNIVMEIGKEVAQTLNAEVKDVRGRTIIIHRKKKMTFNPDNVNSMSTP